MSMFNISSLKHSRKDNPHQYHLTFPTSLGAIQGTKFYLIKSELVKRQVNPKLVWPSAIAIDKCV